MVAQPIGIVKCIIAKTLRNKADGISIRRHSEQAGGGIVAAVI